MSAPRPPGLPWEGLDLAALYRHRFDAAHLRHKARVWAVLVRHFFQRWIQPGDVVLDLGCGYGEFLNNVRCARRLGVDLNLETARHLADGIELHRGPVSDLGFLPEASVDVVFTSNLLEHLPKPEIERTLHEVRRVLRPGGQLLAMGPNIRAIPHRYWDYWDHVTPISDLSLAEVLEAVGFEVEERVPRFLPYTFRSGLPKAPALTWLYLKLPLAWRVFGAQFFLRARRAKDPPRPR